MQSTSPAPLNDNKPTTDSANKKSTKVKSPLQLTFRRFIRNKMAVAGIIMLTIIMLVCIGAPLITDMDPQASDLYNVTAEPDNTHWLGTDDSGRDVFARLLYGGRVSLLVGFVSMIFAVLIGTTVGATAAYFGRWVDNILMRFADMVLIYPTILLVLTVVAILEKSNMWLLTFTMAAVSWATVARIVRSEVLSLREREFVLSARSIGCSDGYIISRHILPNIVGPIVVTATIWMGNMILLESALSFLGFGVPQPTPTWGNMLSDATRLQVLTMEPWRWVPPGLMIVMTVLSINFIGDGLRDAFDARSTRR